MASVLVGIVIEGVNCPIAPSFLFFMALVGINVLAALLHFDPGTLLYGIIYFLFIPRYVFFGAQGTVFLMECLSKPFKLLYLSSNILDSKLE